VKSLRSLTQGFHANGWHLPCDTNEAGGNQPWKKTVRILIAIAKLPRARLSAKMGKNTAASFAPAVREPAWKIVDVGIVTVSEPG
jgi:hypothetical protein